MNTEPWTPEVRAMWMKLDGFQFGQNNAVFDFSTRLAQENGWGAGYTARVLQEYKRFLLLAMHAGHPVTPPDAVDQAWHLHLVYTRSYWEDLCRGVLGRALHHGPTQGGVAEGAKFASWYEDTLGSYTRFFGTAPPPDIWPALSGRFDPCARFERVDRAQFWLVPKSGLRKAAMAAGTASATLVLGACATQAWAGGDGLVVLGFACVAVCAGIGAWRALRCRSRGNGRRGGCGGGFSCGGGSAGCAGGRDASDRSGGHSGCGHHGGESGCGSSGCGGGGCGGGGD